jgi:hypothetical protein
MIKLEIASASPRNDRREQCLAMTEKGRLAMTKKERFAMTEERVPRNDRGSEGLRMTR